VRRIPALPFGVHHCSVLPHKGSDEFFVEVGAVPEHPGPLRISVTGIRELAKVAGLPSGDESVMLLEDRDRLLVENRALLEQVDELERFAQAIDTIESADFRARKRPGRKPQKQQEEVGV